MKTKDRIRPKIQAPVVSSFPKKPPNIAPKTSAIRTTHIPISRTVSLSRDIEHILLT